MALAQRRRTSSVARQILALQLLVVGVVVAVGLALAYLDASRDQREQAVQKVLAVATTTADSPQILRALRTPDPSSQLQPWAEGIRADTGTDFVVVMSPDGVRYTHPDPSQLGGRYRGSIAEAQRGEVHVEEYTGTLGPSVRAVVPVRDGGRIVALVSVGITTAAIERSLLPTLPTIALAAAIVLVVGALGAWAISRRLHRQTHGLGEREITRMFEYYDAVLHAVREGLVLLDRSGRIQLVNDEGRDLLGLGDDAVGCQISALGLPEPLVDSVQGEATAVDEIHLVGPRMLVVNKTPAVWQGRTVGSVITLRDHTDLQAISGELDTAKGLADTLRSQNHEAANRLHTVVSLIEMGRTDDAVEFATRELEVAQRLTDRVVSAVDDPVLAAVLLGKSAQAQERGVEFRVDPESFVSDLTVDPQSVVTMIGNLVDNALDAVTETEPPRQVAVLVTGGADHFRLVVEDSGPGLTPEEARQAFRRGWSTKGTAGGLGRGIGLALVVQAVRRHGGTVSVDRSPLGGARFTIVIGGSADPAPDRSDLASVSDPSGPGVAAQEIPADAERGR
ncbi:MAG TPA: sensor histidine kinase [Microlunatus sp.]|nr:sensor histidine kinase [Microlunatus sp.]